jgi:hypothetical protein
MGESLQKTVGATMFNPGFGSVVTSVQPSVANATAQQPATAAILSGGLQLAEMTVASLGMLLFIGLGLVGCLAMLGKNSTPLHKAFVVLCLIVLSIGFVPHMFGISVIEHRWWYLSEVLMAIPLGIALYKLASVNRPWLISAILVAVVIAFLSTIGLASNMTNKALVPNLTVRYALTDGELASLSRITAAEYSNKTIGTDPILALPTRSIVNNSSGAIKQVSITHEILSGDFSDSLADVLLLRNSLSSEPFGFGGGDIYKIDYDIASVAAQQGYQKAWETEEVVCLIRH